MVNNNTKPNEQLDNSRSSSSTSGSVSLLTKPAPLASFIICSHSSVFKTSGTSKTKIKSINTYFNLQVSTYKFQLTRLAKLNCLSILKALLH